VFVQRPVPGHLSGLLLRALARAFDLRLRVAWFDPRSDVGDLAAKSGRPFAELVAVFARSLSASVS